MPRLRLLWKEWVDIRASAGLARRYLEGAWTDETRAEKMAFLARDFSTNECWPEEHS